MRGGNGHALGAVDGAAAAHGDQAVAALLPVEGSGCAYGGLGGIGGRLVEDGMRQVAQCVQRLLQHAGRLDALVGDDQRPRDAHALALLAQQPHGAEVELDLGDVVDEGHGRWGVAGRWPVVESGKCAESRPGVLHCKQSKP
jgi:hypothetical protein